MLSCLPILQAHSKSYGRIVKRRDAEKAKLRYKADDIMWFYDDNGKLTGWCLFYQ